MESNEHANTKKNKSNILDVVEVVLALLMLAFAPNLGFALFRNCIAPKQLKLVEIEGQKMCWSNLFLRHHSIFGVVYRYFKTKSPNKSQILPPPLLRSLEQNGRT